MPALANMPAYLVVTASYWVFTLSDGALRMLVLGHFHMLGYSPIELASLFLLYEAFGVATNFSGGWIASRTGVRLTLLVGLFLQLTSLLALSFLPSTWSSLWQVVFVISVQGLSGIAKDFTKMSAKSALKLLVVGGHGTLFRWVALLTGSKNSLKGIGFFLGGALLVALGFSQALWLFAAALGLAFVCALVVLPAELGRSKAKHKLADAIRPSADILRLSVARLFLFSARDVWFVVGLPIYLVEILGWSFASAGSFLALWVIGYGIVQALTPRLLKVAPGKYVASAKLWIVPATLVPLAIAGLLVMRVDPTIVVVAGLAVFGFIFAINSAVHSFLILAYSSAERASLNVGFYYMANALGRLLGTLLSGLTYQQYGLNGCLLLASALLMIASLVSLGLGEPDSL